MSADYWLVIDTGGEEPATVENDFNVTYNLTPMLRAAGFPGHQAMVGAPCTEAGGVLARTARRLREDPERFKSMNPSNGWGSYDVAIEFCDRLTSACARHPLARLAAWL